MGIKRKIIAFAFIASSIPFSCHAENLNDVYNTIAQMIVAPRSVGKIRNYIYFDPDLKDRHQICVDDASYEKRNLAGWVDEEGGSVRRFKESWELDSAERSGRLPLNLYRQKAKVAANHLKNYCVAVNLGVVADGYSNKSEMIYRGRSYSDNLTVVNQYANVWADALREEGIAVGWKHFPGATDNIHVEKSNPEFKDSAWEQSVDDSSLQLIQAHARAFENHGHEDVLMVSQTIYPAIGAGKEKRPAVLEPEVVKMAHEVQPHSLLLTDDLSELNLSDSDLEFLFHNYDFVMFLNPKDVIRFASVIGRDVQSGKINEKELDDKIARLALWKSKN